MNVIAFQFKGNWTICNGVNFLDGLTDPQAHIIKAQLPPTEVHAWMVIEWPQYICINYSPGSIKGMIENKRMQDVSQLINICGTNPIQVLQLDAIFL